VEKLLEDSNFKIVASYKRTGTVVISCGDYKFEYTTFRQDSYPLKSGTHTPSECVFTKDIKTDALRRDFTCNSLYYDIAQDKIIDLVNGVQDIKDRVLRTVREPKETLSEDALRIMRLVRFAVELGFDIKKETFDAAKDFSYGLKDISKERIKDELVAIFKGVFKYNSKDSGTKPSDGIRLLVDIGAMEYIIPEVVDMIGVPQNPKFHVFDVYNHTLHTIDNLPPELMMAGLLHDIAKSVILKKYGNMYMHKILGSNMTKEIMSRLKFPKGETERISTLVRIHMFNVDGKTRLSKCRVFIADNWDYFDDFILLRRADGMATNPNNYDESLVQNLIDIKNQMIKDGMPITIKDLSVNGNDLLECGYKGKEISETLEKIRLWILQNGRVPTREEILNKLRREK
ncbi:MAG: HD domain-containing protein, partial [Clostridia bacterium]|nr:HD domain-containing protein [Clostridia bacterium]